MASLIFRKQAPNSYSRISSEDPEELVHRRAQFLIYKAMQQIDNSRPRRRPSQVRLRISKLKVRIGKRLKKLRRSLLVSVCLARACLARQLKQLVCCKDRPSDRNGNAAAVPAAMLFS